LQNLEINKPENDGKTPFHAACCEGHSEIVKELMKQIPNIVID